VKEIVPGYPRHFDDLQRVKYEFRRDSLDWSELAEEINNQSQAMVVLNTRKDALALIDAMGETSHIYHLSTLLCGRHRKDKLKEIRSRLDDGQPVRLISTQVVEAGVDLDFPVVYRALGPLDRIVQAAGRCNREGKLDKGQVVIFEPSEGRMPRGPYFAGFQKAKLMLDENDVHTLGEPQIFTEYFKRLYGDLDLDENNIQIHREALDYPKVARLYRLITDITFPVVVRHGDYKIHLKDWKFNPSRKTWRQLQPFIVNVFEYEAGPFIRDGIMEELGNGLYLWNGKYDEKIGVVAEYDPADLLA
jgi:CRISPR-associated endonuclease/helicase Cas3